MSLKRKAENVEASMSADGDEKEYKKSRNFEPSRAIYLGNIQAATMSYFDICTLANEHGAIETVKIMPQKGCAFLNFVEESAAKAFFEACQKEAPKIGEQTLKVSFAKTTEIAEDLKKQIEGGAARNLFVGNVSELVSEDMLAQLFARFGPFENIIILRQKGIAFVNLTSVRNAIQAKSTLDGHDLAGKKIKVNFAKEKIGLKPSAVRRPNRPFLATTDPTPRIAGLGVPLGGVPLGGVPLGGGLGLGLGLGPAPGLFPPAPLAPLAQASQFFPGQIPDPFAHNPSAPRGIYLGNVQGDVTAHELCKVANRFGALESVKIVEGKQCAFLNFVDPAAAHAFWASAQHQPITIGANTLKVNWAKSGMITPEVMNAIRQGATRNLFVGNIEDHISEELLRETFREHGEIDNIVILRPKKIAFVNLTSIHSALAAREKLQGRQVGDPPVTLKINFAKEVSAGGRKAAPRLPAAPGPASAVLRDAKLDMSGASELSSSSSLFSQFPPVPPAESMLDDENATTSFEAGPGSRAIYLGGLPADTTARDLCTFANNYGQVEQLAYMAEKKCCFINFVESSVAARIMSELESRPVNLRGKPIKVSWAKSSSIDSALQDQIENGATRNLFVGSVAPGVTQESLAQIFAPFGPIENISILSPRGIAFVNLCSIKSAITAKATLNREPGTVVLGMRLKISFAKEKIAGKG